MSDDRGPAGTPGADDGATTLRYEYDRSREPSTAIVEGVAAATNREPTELPPLHEFVDPGALDELMTRGVDEAGDPIDVTFVYDRVAIRVTSVGTIEITVEPEAD